MDKDFAIARGSHRGYPKKLGSIHQTRPHRYGPAPRIEAGARFGAPLAAADRRLAQAVVTLVESGAPGVGAEDLAQRANAAFERSYGELVDGGLIAPVPGAREAVEELAADGRTVVLTTGFARVTRDAILDALGWRGLVPLALCPADAGGRGRPYPDMVLEAFLRTRAAEDVAQVAVVGDTSYDILSGVRAGAGLVAGVRTGAHGDEAFRAAGATHVLDSVAGLPALLRAVG
ncbi:HAD family hydrolase [Streptomyces javensis]|uniref:Haloacid dehalogenase n=1 Tax=Streptomyces javensis TaxID=114698 RepID=A0ABN1WSC6_9ACTN